jgi:short-subunit dehydrogenase
LFILHNHVNRRTQLQLTKINQSIDQLLSQRTTITAGASTGIGFHAAESLAKEGFIVFAGVR